MKILALSIFFGFVAVTTSTTTHKPHGTREPYEGDNVNFQYDPNSHVLISRTKYYCYLMALNPAEQVQVHSPDGMRSLEIRQYQLMSSAVHQAAKGSDVLHMSRYVFQNFCFNQSLIVLHD